MEEKGKLPREKFNFFGKDLITIILKTF